MARSILKKPLISEKSFKMAAEGKFCFIVDKAAGKDSVSAAISELFDVEVTDVNVCNFKGKVKRTKKGSGKRSDFKKAVVTLKKGQKIDLFDVEKDAASAKGGAGATASSKAGMRGEEKSAGDKDTTVKVREKKK